MRKLKEIDESHPLLFTNQLCLTPIAIFKTNNGDLMNTTNWMTRDSHDSSREEMMQSHSTYPRKLQKSHKVT